MLCIDGTQYSVSIEMSKLPHALDVHTAYHHVHLTLLIIGSFRDIPLPASNPLMKLYSGRLFSFLTKVAQSTLTYGKFAHVEITEV